MIGYEDLYPMVVNLASLDIPSPLDKQTGSWQRDSTHAFELLCAREKFVKGSRMPSHLQRRMQSVSDVLSLCKGKVCTDWHDKIYGLVSLIDDNQSFPIDYASNRTALMRTLIDFAAPKSSLNTLDLVYESTIAIELPALTLTESNWYGKRSDRPFEWAILSYSKNSQTLGIDLESWTWRRLREPSNIKAPFNDGHNIIDVGDAALERGCFFSSKHNHVSAVNMHHIDPREVHPEATRYLWAFIVGQLANKTMPDGILLLGVYPALTCLLFELSYRQKICFRMNNMARDECRTSHQARTVVST